MLKVLLLILSVGLFSSTATALTLGVIDEQQISFDKAVCGAIAENYARGNLSDKGIKAHSTRAEVFPFSDNIYGVVVKTQVVVDIGLIEKGPDVGYSCFRCPNLKLVVSQESSTEACKNEKL